MHETGFLYFLFFNIHKALFIPSLIFVDANPFNSSMAFFNNGLFSYVFLTNDVTMWATVVNTIMQILSSGPNIFIKYLKESFTRFIFLPIILPLTSTTQTKSIGGLSNLFETFLVFTDKTAGTTNKLIILFIHLFFLIGSLSGYNLISKFYINSSAVIPSDIVN